jgi:hypothetical protein
VRQLKRVVRNYLEFPIYDLMLSGQLTPGMAAVVTHEAPRNYLNFRVMVPFYDSWTNVPQPRPFHDLKAGAWV